MNELFVNVMVGIMCAVVVLIGGWSVFNEHRGGSNVKEKDEKDA